jgi:hypothetical protein
MPATRCYQLDERSVSTFYSRERDPLLPAPLYSLYREPEPAPAFVCHHVGTGTIYNKERGIACKADCGSRARCPAARRRWRNGMRERLSLVKYFRAPDLWTFTARTADQDALYRAIAMKRRAPGSGLVPSIDAILIDGLDRGAVNKENIAILNRGLERVVRHITRQFDRQLEPGYMQTGKARRLRAKYGTARPVRGRPGAALHIRVREAGEMRGRIHAHVASDYDFLLHAWLDDACLRCGLGHPQFERKETRVMRAAARFSGPRVRSETIGLYLSKYLSKTSDDAPWPWPARTRLVSAGLRRKLPLRVPKPGWSWAPASVAVIAVDELGAACVDPDATFYSRERDPLLPPRGPPGDIGADS